MHQHQGIISIPISSPNMNNRPQNNQPIPQPANSYVKPPPPSINAAIYQPSAPSMPIPNVDEEAPPAYGEYQPLQPGQGTDETFENEIEGQPATENLFFSEGTPQKKNKRRERKTDFPFRSVPHAEKKYIFKRYHEIN